MRVGYLLAEKKAQALGLLDGVKQKLNALNVEVVNIDDRQPLESQGPFHMIIHKLSDYQRDADNGDPIASRIIQEMYTYQKQHSSSCVFIDSIDMVFQLANRATMSGICEKTAFKLGDYRVYVPAWIQIDHKAQLPHIAEQLALKGVTYPILCKALNAAEGPGAHDMQLVFNSHQLMNELEIVPCIAQSFINHDMNMCKIFVVGTSWCIVNRPSIRNFKDSLDIEPACALTTAARSAVTATTKNGFNHENGAVAGNCAHPSIVFNSHQVSKPDSVSFLNKFAKRYHQHVSFGNNELLNDQVVDELIRRLQQVIPFTLMGIDVIVNGKNYGLIDINFLPGYDGMSNFYDEFFKLVLSKLNINVNSTTKLAGSAAHSYPNGSRATIVPSIGNHFKN